MNAGDVVLAKRISSTYVMFLRWWRKYHHPHASTCFFGDCGSSKSRSRLFTRDTYHSLFGPKCVVKSPRETNTPTLNYRVNPSRRHAEGVSRANWQGTPRDDFFTINKQEKVLEGITSTCLLIDWCLELPVIHRKTASFILFFFCLSLQEPALYYMMNESSIKI